MNTTFTRPNASSDETEEVRSVFNHTQHDQSHNSIYLVSPAFEAHPQNLQQSLPRQIFQSNSAVLNDAQLIAEFIDTWLDDSVQADPQNLQQSLPRQNFQSNSAVLNDAQLIAEFFYTWLDDSVQEVTHGSVSQFLNQYMGPELFAKIKGTSTFCAKDYKKSSTSGKAQLESDSFRIVFFPFGTTQRSGKAIDVKSWLCKKGTLGIYLLYVIAIWP
ncbi:unnamed protein product [Rhizophagus irregularis]|nr:unnamed protein product [Rhizophagus irregularis]